MKKTVLILGCLLAIGVTSVSCNRDTVDGLETTPTPTTPATPALSRADLPKKADHFLATILGEQVYDATYSTKNTANPYATTPAKLYQGVTVTGVSKVDPAGADGTVNEVTLSNGVKIGFNADGEWTYADGAGQVLVESVWAFLPLNVQTAIRNGNDITKITKMARTAVNGVYTISFDGGTDKKYNADGTAA